MYALLPWRLLGSVLTGVIACAIYIDDLFRWVGSEISDGIVIRLLPVILLTLFTGIFAPTGYWAPWRIIWRLLPVLNRWFPDLNGVWVGTTNSNWPTINRLIEAAQSGDKVSEQELHNIPEQYDAIAVQITNSLFTLHIRASLSSTNGHSYSIAAKPWRHQHTGRIHLSYVYEQQTPNHTPTDEESHLGAADLALITDDYSRAEGTYWTKRSWKTGRNTAGTLKLMRYSRRVYLGKSLSQHAADHKLKIEVNS